MGFYNKARRYMGVQAKNPADMIRAARAPTTADKSFSLGTIWIDTANNDVYELTTVSSGSAYWVQLGFSSSSIADVAHGGTGRSTLTNRGVLVGAGTSAITQLAAASTGTVLAGVTGADPAFTASPSVTTLTATTVNGTTITTNVAAAQISATATTISATGSDTNVSMNLATKGTGSLVMSRSAAGVDLNMQITNSDNTAAAGHAGLQLAVGGSTSTGDPYVQFAVSGVGASTMTMGLDNSASDLFVISNSTALGTANALTLTQAGALAATTTVTAGTGVTATTGAITATNGNLVLGTAGNKIVSTSVGTTTAAGANSFGSVTLVAGTATVSTTSVTASSMIHIWRQSIGATGAVALGQLTVGTITANTSFVINAALTATATSLATTDVSVVGWMIVN